MKSLLICTVLVFAVLVQTSNGIKCYQCTTCNDPFNKNDKSVTTVPNCAGSCTKVKGSGSGASGVIRACSDTKLADGCNKAKVLDVEVQTCSCSSDLCNSATTSSVSMAVALVSVGGLFVFKNLF